ncbi:hypothetical protein [Serratia fonticola]|uniref:hypothetical protein n=1 Tax=Serratia fonticola TaxID=47917 RepID=UPI0021794933|nr:hypothetical protein [Serratia fonticola]CAI1036872.1 Uncharacterised protein [Serratia fonticola]
MTISIEKVTNAELHQIINKYEKGQCAVIAPKTDYRMAKELLAAREAQSVPVAIVEKSDYLTSSEIVDDKPPRKAVKELYEGAMIIGQHLYTAPPAPAVPAEITTEQMYNLLLEKGGMMSPLEAAMFAWDACRASVMKNTQEAASHLAPSVDNGNMQNTPSGFKLVPVELLSTASMLIDLCRTHTTLNGGGTYNQRVLSDCETTMNAIANLLAAAPTPTKAVPDA